MLSFYLAALETDEERQKMTEIYNEYKDLMARVAFKYSASQDEIEDAVHDSFVEIIKQKETLFPMPCRVLRRYIVSIVRSKCVDRFRKDSLLKQEPLDTHDDSTAVGALSLDEILINQEKYEWLSEALLEIDETSRIILELKYSSNLSYVEIAEKMGITPKYVDTRLMRAKERLRRALERRDASESGSGIR